MSVTGEALYRISTSCPRGGRSLVEDALALRVADLRRPGWGWVAPDLVASDGTTIRTRIEITGDTAAWLHLEHWRPGAAWASASHTLALVPKPQHLGGVRWLFRDPLGFGLCSTLFLPVGASSFGSRQAHGLGYRSQRRRPAARAATRARRLAADLGAVELGAAPTRPKGAWRTKFDRRAAELARLVEVASAG